MSHLKRRRELRDFRESFPTRKEWAVFCAVRNIQETELYALDNWRYLHYNRPWNAAFGKLRVRPVEEDLHEQLAARWWERQLDRRERYLALTLADGYVTDREPTPLDCWRLWRRGKIAPYI